MSLLSGDKIESVSVACTYEVRSLNMGTELTSRWFYTHSVVCLNVPLFCFSWCHVWCLCAISRTWNLRIFVICVTANQISNWIFDKHISCCDIDQMTRLVQGNCYFRTPVILGDLKLSRSCTRLENVLLNLVCFPNNSWYFIQCVWLNNLNYNQWSFTSLTAWNLMQTWFWCDANFYNFQVMFIFVQNLIMSGVIPRVLWYQSTSLDTSFRFSKNTERVDTVEICNALTTFLSGRS